MEIHEVKSMQTKGRHRYKCERWTNIIEPELVCTWMDRTELESWDQVESRGDKILVRALLALLDNRVRETEGSWVLRRQETLLEVYVFASSVELLTSQGLVIWLKLELQQVLIAPNVPGWIEICLWLYLFYWELYKVFDESISVDL